MIVEIEINEAKASHLTAIAEIHRAARMMAMPWLPDLHTPE